MFRLLFNRIEKTLEDYAMLVGVALIAGAGVATLWLLYRIAAGLFHLADKLIDKL